MSENITKEGIEVKVGQVWRDLDKRIFIPSGGVDRTAFEGVTKEQAKAILSNANTRIFLKLPEAAA